MKSLMTNINYEKGTKFLPIDIPVTYLQSLTLKQRKKNPYSNKLTFSILENQNLTCKSFIFQNQCKTNKRIPSNVKTLVMRKNVCSLYTKAFLVAPSLSRYKRQASKFFLVQRLHPRLFIKLTKKKLSRRKGPKEKFNFQDRLSSKICAKVG